MTMRNHILQNRLCTN